MLLAHVVRSAGIGASGWVWQLLNNLLSPSSEKIRRNQGRSSSVEAGEDAGDYTVISSIEFGYRGLSVDGDLNKYQSDLNYKAGPRLFDSSFLMKSKDGKGELFDTLLVTSTGWGADPNGNMRISVEKPKWYRFDGTYRQVQVFQVSQQLRESELGI